MKKDLLKILEISVFLVLFSTFAANAQTPIPAEELFLNKPIESEIVDGKTTIFKVNLAANQTAKISAAQTGADVSLSYFDPTGEKVLEWGIGLGRVGSEEILVIAETAGEYKIEVTPGNRHGNFGGFVIELKEIRKTNENDHVTNQTANEIMRLMPEAMRLARLDTNAERRTSYQLWNEILQLSKLKKDKISEARALHAMGSLLLELGELQKALETLIQVVENWRNLNIRRFEMIATDRIALIWYNVGEYEKAAAAYDEARKINVEIKSKIDEALSLSNIGGSYVHLNQPKKAIEFFNEALEMAVEMKIPVLEAAFLNDLGRAHFALADYEKAIEYYDKALIIAEKGDFLRHIVQNLIELGVTYKELNKNETAYEYLSRANSRTNEIDNFQLMIRLNYFLAIAESERGALDKAIRHLENSLKTIEKIRGEFRNKKLRTSYFSTVQNIYELYTDLLIERSKKNNPADVALAFEVSERSRSRSLNDLLQEAKIDFGQSVDVKLVEKEKDLTDEINAKYQTRENLLERSAKQEQINKINTEITELELELEKLNVQIRRANPRYADLKNGVMLTADKIQNLLDDKTVLLEYKLGKNRSFLWLVTKNSLEVFELPKREEIEADAREFYDKTVANKQENEFGRNLLAAKLGDVLLSKVENKIKGKRIAVIADGILQYIPFSALRVGKDHLSDTNEIVILPSATVLAQLRENKKSVKPNEMTIAIFADPVFDSGDSRISKNTLPETEFQNVSLTQTLRDFRFDESLPRLLASREEARNISQFVESDKVSLKLGFNANLKNIENNRDLSKYRILHFATHGLLNTSRPELSGLVFSLYDEKGRDQDGFLNLNDVYNLDISSDLVVLSACQTALGKDVRGEGLIGISRGFLYAGSQRILASLWKVDDSATAEFMKLFYKYHLAEKMSAAASLRRAKIDMKKIPRYKSPYYWSAFILLGEWK